MFRKVGVSFLLSSLCVLSSQAFAVDGKTYEENMVQRLRDKFPGTQITKIVKTPVAGQVYEVHFGGNVAYVFGDERHVIVGHIFDTKDQVDITQKAIEKNRKIEFEKLPFSDAVQMKKGDGSRKLAVIFDPNCPFCNKLYGQLEKLNDVTVYIFLLPFSQQTTGSNEKPITDVIWCSKDRNASLKEYLSKTKSELVSAECNDTPSDRNIELARSIGLQGTPTIILPSGQVLNGARSVEEIEAALSLKK